jgi:hypothetical protein
MGRNALRRSVGKLLPVDIYERADQRYHVVWRDETGKRRFASRGSMAEAKSFQMQKIAELQRHRETRFDLDDKQMYSLARDLAASQVKFQQRYQTRHRKPRDEDARWGFNSAISSF